MSNILISCDQDNYVNSSKNWKRIEKKMKKIKIGIKLNIMLKSKNNELKLGKCK